MFETCSTICDKQIFYDSINRFHKATKVIFKELLINLKIVPLIV